MLEFPDVRAAIAFRNEAGQALFALRQMVGINRTVLHDTLSDSGLKGGFGFGFGVKERGHLSSPSGQHALDARTMRTFCPAVNP